VINLLKWFHILPFFKHGGDVAPDDVPLDLGGPGVSIA
jgi:hypothetical protein